MEKKKILITGFPHTGTSILKSKMGECENLYEFPFESPFVEHHHILNSNDKEFVLVKYPMLPLDIRVDGPGRTRILESRYFGYIIIFVIRNPWNLFTSIIKAGNNPLNECDDHRRPEYHSKVSEYLVSAEMFLNARNNNYKDIYTIKYEEFFDNDCKAIKNIMDSIGLKYKQNIFETKSKEYIHWPGIKLDNLKESELDYKNKRYEYRTWQINQPFQNMNGEVNIPDELDKILKESPIIKELGYFDPRLTN